MLRRNVWEVYDTLDRATAATEVQRMVLTVLADEAGRVIAASDPHRAPVDCAVAPLLEGGCDHGDGQQPAYPGQCAIGVSGPPGRNDCQRA